MRIYNVFPISFLKEYQGPTDSKQEQRKSNANVKPNLYYKVESILSH